MANQTPPKLAALTESEVRTINQLIHEVKQLRQIAALRNHEDGTHQSPEVYVVRPQEGSGIPPLTTVFEDTVNPDGSTTLAGDRPGKALCDLYQVDEAGETLLKIEGSETYVLNLSTSALTQGWLLAVRDKYGKYFATASDTSSSGTSEGIDEQCNCWLCIPPEEAVIGSCPAAPNGAAERYQISFGLWVPHPEMMGTVDVWYQTPQDCDSSSSSSSSTSSTSQGIGECTWVSCPITVYDYSTSSSSSSITYGTYQWWWTFFLDADGETQLEVEPKLLEGVDWLGICEP